jgi:hypothetical protein
MKRVQRDHSGAKVATRESLFGLTQITYRVGAENLEDFNCLILNDLWLA